MIEHLAVIVPAHNEEDEVSDCLTAILRSLSNAQSRPDLSCSIAEVVFQVIVVVDACTDGTLRLVEEFAGRHPVVDVLVTSFNNVGRARNAAGDHLLQAVGGSRTPLDATWMAFTDADSRVPEHWIASHLDAAQQGADCLVGTVAPRPETASAELISRWHTAHDLAEGHSHVFGANLGLRASCFAAIEGIPPLACGEDAAVVAAVVAIGAEVRRTDACRVLTSARLDGRAAGGFSTYLRNLVQVGKG